jgi:DMSO/TMAO reductase YedYZ molybdopterin-dependent catalytic subunit
MKKGTDESSRRRFFKKTALLAFPLVIAGLVGRWGVAILEKSQAAASTKASNLPPIFSDHRLQSLLSYETTNNADFFQMDLYAPYYTHYPSALCSPRLDPNKYTLTIQGKVKEPLMLDLKALEQFPTADEYETIECVLNTINPPGSMIGTAKWTGARLGDLLRHAGVMPEAKYVVFRCADGYDVGIPLDKAMHPGTLLAYRMNDQVLPLKNGYPVRTVVPGIYGMKNAKYVTEIEVVDYEYVGYWQREEYWSNDLKIKTKSIILYPKNRAQVDGATPIAGVAFAGDRGISRVEVSLDGGQTWNETVLKQPPSPYVWVLWAYQWNMTKAGTYTIVVRAYDGQGVMQDSKDKPRAHPEGVSGYHSIQVTVA